MSPAEKLLNLRWRPLTGASDPTAVLLVTSGPVFAARLNFEDSQLRLHCDQCWSAQRWCEAAGHLYCLSCHHRTPYSSELYGLHHWDSTSGQHFLQETFEAHEYYLESPLLAGQLLSALEEATLRFNRRSLEEQAHYTDHEWCCLVMDRFVAPRCGLPPVLPARQVPVSR